METKREKGKFAHELPKRTKRPKRAEKPRYVPPSLRVKPAPQNYASLSKYPASLILSWADDRWKSSTLVFDLSETDAAHLLEIFPPCVTTNGEYKAVVGHVAMSVGLLRCLAPERSVRAINLSNENPFSCAHIPIELILPAESTPQKIKLAEDLTQLLINRKPTQAELGKILGKTRSAVSKMLSLRERSDE